MDHARGREGPPAARSLSRRRGDTGAVRGGGGEERGATQKLSRANCCGRPAPLSVIASQAERPRLKVSNCGLVWAASLAVAVVGLFKWPCIRSGVCPIDIPKIKSSG